MRYLISFIFVGFALIGTASGDSNDNSKNAAWLLSRLQTLADTGILFDPQAVRQLLSLDQTLIASPAPSQSSNCSNPYAHADTNMSTYENPNWLKPPSEGMQNMPIPAIAINPAGVSGPPTFSYRYAKTTACNSDLTLANAQEAKVQIGLPAFACYQANDLIARLQAKTEMATDGVYFVVYPGKHREEDGTTLRFTFRFGAPCALDAEVDQKTNLGDRYARASEKQRACLKKAHRHYCDEHGSITWSESDKIDLMERAAIETCGGITKFYTNEVDNRGPPPPPGPPEFPAAPCDR
jgi:hypothetical protein